jgi:hypothetical protein
MEEWFLSDHRRTGGSADRVNSCPKSTDTWRIAGDPPYKNEPVQHVMTTLPIFCPVFT